MRSRRIVAAVSVLALAGLAYASTSASRDRGPARAGDAPVVADGVVLDKQQQGMVGVPVRLYAAPVPPVGKTAAMVVVADTVSGDGGEFTLGAEASAALQKLAGGKDRWLNFDFVAGSPALHVYRSVARKFVEDRWIGPEQNDSSSSMGAVILAPGEAGVGFRKGREAAATLAAGTDCNGVVTTLQTRTVATPIGELHTTPNMSGRLTYGPTADSDVDVTESWDNGSTWWLSDLGPAHIDTHRSTAAVKNVGTGNTYDRRSLSNFVYTKLEETSPCDGQRLIVEATRWTGSMLTGGTAPDPTNRCAAASAGNKLIVSGSFTRSSALAGGYAGSVNLGGLGVHASGGGIGAVGVVSGYSGSVRARWTFGSGSHTLCGDTAGPATSKHIFAGS